MIQYLQTLLFAEDNTRLFGPVELLKNEFDSEVPRSLLITQRDGTRTSYYVPCPVASIPLSKTFQQLW